MLVLGVTLWSLQSHPNRSREPGAELHNVDRIAHAEGLDQLPQRLFEACPSKPTESRRRPVLGDPLPGDLGVPPCLRAEQNAYSDNPNPRRRRRIVRPPIRPLKRRASSSANREREAEDAAKAPLFFRGANQRQGVQPRQRSALTATGRAVLERRTCSRMRTATVATSNGSQDEKNAFLARGSDEATRSSHALQAGCRPTR